MSGWVLIVFLLGGPVIVEYTSRSACESARADVIAATGLQAACYPQRNTTDRRPA